MSLWCGGIWQLTADLYFTGSLVASPCGSHPVLTHRLTHLRTHTCNVSGGVESGENTGPSVVSGCSSEPGV